MMSLREVAHAWVLAVLTLGLTAPTHAQNETTAALTGEVRNASGDPIAHAAITLRHAPTHEKWETHTNTSGFFSLPNLPVGGPFTLTATDQDLSFTDNITLELGENPHLKITLSPPTEPLPLAPLTITANRLDLSAPPNTTLEGSQLENIPSIERSINDYARQDPRVVILDTERGELSAAGQNARFNTLQIDGIRLNDSFGLTANGLPSQGNPFSMETVEAVSIDLAPYDASRNGFTGASINVVTRRGTNQFHGSSLYTYRNQNFRAKNPTTHTRDPFADQTASLTFSGPLLRDRLFFFIAYEHSERTEPAPAPGFTPDATELTRLITASYNYGYTPGALTNPGKQRKQDDKYLARLDWYLSPNQHLTARYSHTRGHQPSFVDYTTPGRISLSDHWYESRQTLDALSAQLFSQWHDSFHTEIKLASSLYEAARLNPTRFPQVRINNFPSADSTDAGSIFIGTDESSQLNHLRTRNTQASARAIWLLGRQKISLGLDHEYTAFENTFLQNAFGNYSFASLNAFIAGTPSSYTHQYTLPGHSPSVTWSYSVSALYLQDDWHPTPHLTLSSGLRLESTSTDPKPEYNPLFHQTFGRRNDTSLDTSPAFAPRLSFLWQTDSPDKRRLRGGIGLFHGRAPGVWLSNPYSNNGLSSLVNTSISTFNPDPDNQPTGNPATRRQRVDLLDENFHFPSVLRANLAIEQLIPGTKLKASAELLQTWTRYGLTYQNLNLLRTATGPDGRAIYGTRTTGLNLSSNSQYTHAAFSDVYLLTNTRAGSATQLTLKLQRPLRAHWAATLAYTTSRARETSPTTSSTAGTNFSTRASLDPNAEETSTANTEVRDRILASITGKFIWLRKHPTKFTLAYEGHSGRPYSFIFGSDVNGDSSDYSNDLLYVPSGRDDPKVRWNTPAQADAFFDYLARTPNLARFSGQVAPRNSERSPFVHQFDFKLTQTIPLWKNLHAELFGDILNLGNLLNSRWGRLSQVNFPHGLIVAYASYDPATNQYVYRYTGARSPTLQSGPSRWQIQTGLRLKF